MEIDTNGLQADEAFDDIDFFSDSESSGSSCAETCAASLRRIRDFIDASFSWENLPNNPFNLWIKKLESSKDEFAQEILGFINEFSRTLHHEFNQKKTVDIRGQGDDLKWLNDPKTCFINFFREFPFPGLESNELFYSEQGLVLFLQINPHILDVCEKYMDSLGRCFSEWRKFEVPRQQALKFIQKTEINSVREKSHPAREKRKRSPKIDNHDAKFFSVTQKKQKRAPPIAKTQEAHPYLLRSKKAKAADICPKRFNSTVG